MISDRRKIPAYSIPEAAHYLSIPASTLRSWVCGGRDRKPVIFLDDKNTYPVALSFLNLVEAYVLVALTKERSVNLQKVRKALDFVKRKYKLTRPLIDEQFQTDGVELFIEKYGNLVNVSREGQYAMKEILKEFLTRIERDENGLPIKLFPQTYSNKSKTHSIVIDPRISFGRPALVGTGIATSVLADRFKAGESFAELAEDYGRSKEEIEEAIRCELAA